MVRLQNKKTSEIVTIHNVKFDKLGSVVSEGSAKGEQFCAKWDFVLDAHNMGDPSNIKQFFTIREGWEPVRRASALMNDGQPKPKREKKVSEKEAQPKQNEDETKKDDKPVYLCEDFEDMVRDVKNGRNVYMYGAAGCGKSFTAERIAERLGLPYFEVMQMEFAHDVKGYGDAAGRYIETAMYKAMVEGGLLFMDEFDRSTTQVTTVVNQVLEARRFDFPVVGMVKAHPNFRIIAAGNTAMNGLNNDYAAAQVIDASTRNRFTFYEMSYDGRVELNIIAKGNEELVNFIEDVRGSIKDAQIPCIVSYRNTSYLTEWNGSQQERTKAIKRGLFGGLDRDTICTIYGGLKDKENVWAKAMKELVK